MNPDGPEMNKTAPASFKAKFETSAGEFVVEVTRNWAPNGADRFYNLVRNGFYNDTRFFRVIPGFIVQWGMHGDPEVTAKWHGARIPDDPVKQGNEVRHRNLRQAGARKEQPHRAGVHQPRRQHQPRRPEVRRFRQGDRRDGGGSGDQCGV